MIIETDRACNSLGQITYGATKADTVGVTRHRSIYIVQEIKAGEVLTTDNLRCIRPDHGLSPKHYRILIGKIIKCDTKNGTPMKWDLVA